MVGSQAGDGAAESGGTAGAQLQGQRSGSGVSWGPLPEAVGRVLTGLICLPVGPAVVFLGWERHLCSLSLRHTRPPCVSEGTSHLGSGPPSSRLTSFQSRLTDLILNVAHRLRCGVRARPPQYLSYDGVQMRPQ